jgi:hypothetical protein
VLVNQRQGQHSSEIDADIFILHSTHGRALLFALPSLRWRTLCVTCNIVIRFPKEVDLNGCKTKCWTGRTNRWKNHVMNDLVQLPRHEPHAFRISQVLQMKSLN